MPGIITHSKILQESINLLSRKDKRSYLLKSIASLFQTQEHLTAGLFGAIGPNMFDYLPFRSKKSYYGNSISFFLHNGGSNKLIKAMINTIYSYADKNTEWAAQQRAYLYGYISHIVADAIFHPYIFYYSGFPNTYSKKEISHFREQNLIFQYNIDNYYLYYDEKSEDFNFNLKEMLPVVKTRILERVNKPLKTFIIESFKETYPDIYKKLFWLKPTREEGKDFLGFGYLDLIPSMIKLAYWVKRNKGERFIKFIKNIRRRNLIYSDFIIRYPSKKETNRNILNFHKERWQNPAGKSGLHYESINNLFAQSCEKIVELWQGIESCIYTTENKKVIEKFKINAYTGDDKLAYNDLKIKSPIRLSI